jgi:2-haloalkanoic acid dehalogenase type II
MSGLPYDVITFDCYGTLVDWEEGISRAFAEAAASDGLTVDRRAVLEAHAEIEPEEQAGEFRSYREVLQETARRIAGRLGWSVSPEGAAFLPESLRTWHPFDDTNQALRRLARAGYALGILSNVDDDLLAGTLSQLDVAFDPVVTAQHVRSYKPDHGHFLEARRRIGDRRWLHAAQSLFHDVVPARELGIPVVWINRKAEPTVGDARPDRELRGMSDLADWLA